MHLGLARAQLLPRSDGYRRFTGSPIDALVCGSTSVMLPGHVCSTNSCTADAVSRTELDWRNSNKS